MKKITFYIGSYDKDTKKQELLNYKFYELFDFLFECYTLQHASGRYKHYNGIIVSEQTFIVSQVIEDNKRIDDFKSVIETLKLNLNQESIMVELDNQVYFL